MAWVLGMSPGHALTFGPIIMAWSLGLGFELGLRRKDGKDLYLEFGEDLAHVSGLRKLRLLGFRTGSPDSAWSRPWARNIKINTDFKSWALGFEKHVGLGFGLCTYTREA